jgi:hypothetical protein
MELAVVVFGEEQWHNLCSRNSTAEKTREEVEAQGSTLVY